MATAEQEVAEQVEEQPPTDVVELDRWIGWKMRRIQQLRAQQAQNTAVAKAEVEQITRWCDEQNHTLQSSIDWFEQQILQAARAYPYQGGKKSRTLPYGRFGSKEVPEQLSIVDRTAAIAFAKAHTVPVRVKEEPDAKALREYFDSTGIVPDGCEHVPARESYYVTVQEAQQ